MAAVLAICPDAPRSWTETIDNYLINHDIKYKQATPLKGGNSAYIWRLDGFEDNVRTHDRSVFKYGDTEIKGLPDFKLPPGRMHTEVIALNTDIIRQICQQEAGVQVPRVLHTTEDGFVMSWGGEVDLRTAFINDQNLDTEAVGSKLGRWLARLHAATIGHEEVKALSNGLMDMVLGHEAAHLRSGLKQKGFDDGLIDRAAMLLQDPSAPLAFTVSDFRPMNTLLQSKGTPDPISTIVDFECARYGDPAVDLRLWVAESMVTEAKYGKGRGMLSSFLAAYKEIAGSSIVDQEFICRAAVLAGSMIFWLMPMAVWDVTTEEEGEYWRSIAIEYVRAGAEGDMEWLSKSVLGPLFPL